MLPAEHVSLYLIYPKSVRCVQGPLSKDDPAIASLSAGFTISLWAKWTEASPTVVGTDTVITHANDNNFINGMGGAGSNYMLSTGIRMTEPLTTEQLLEWHHYAFSFDPSVGLTFYVDGVHTQTVVKDYTYAGTWLDNAPLLHLGGMCYYPPADGSPIHCFPDRPSFAVIDDWAMWGGVLSASEISSRWDKSLTARVAAGLEPNLVFFYNFNDPISFPGEVVNVGTAGTAYNLVLGEVGFSATPHTTFRYGGAVQTTKGIDAVIHKPDFVARGPISNKEDDPTTEPHVVYAAAGETIQIVHEPSIPAYSYTAPDPFVATAVISVPDSVGAGAPVHVVPIAMPHNLGRQYTHKVTVEDHPLAMRLLAAEGYTYSGYIRPKIVALPVNGQLFEISTWSSSLRDAPITSTPHTVTSPSGLVLYVPNEHASGTPLDSFDYVMTLDWATAEIVSSSATTVTIDVLPVNDIPSVSSMQLGFDEDSRSDGVEVVLNVTDSEVEQVLAGYITKLPTKGRLFAVDEAGARIAIDAAYNPFDVGSPTVSQYVSRVVKVSSFWGSPPYSGVHSNLVHAARPCFAGISILVGLHVLLMGQYLTPSC